MLGTRSRFESVIEPAQLSAEEHQAFNQGLRDIALFLSHDFNPDAVSMIRDDAFALRDEAKALGQHFEACRVAAEKYVATAAPTGVLIQSQLDHPQGQPDQEADARATDK